MTVHSKTAMKPSERSARHLLAQVVSFGTRGYDQQTRRRLRLINSSVLIAIGMILGLFLVVSVFFPSFR